MNTVRITYIRDGRPIRGRIIHAPAWMGEMEARHQVFGFDRRRDRVERESFVFDAVGKPASDSEAVA